MTKCVRPENAPLMKIQHRSSDAYGAVQGQNIEEATLQGCFKTRLAYFIWKNVIVRMCNHGNNKLRQHKHLV